VTLESDQRADAQPPSATPPSSSIDRIFDQPAEPFPRTRTSHASRRAPFRLFSFRPRLGGRTLALIVIALAIVAAWYATH